MKYLVYKVTFPNGKCYIGITSKSLEFRKNKHFSELKKGTNYKFHNALRKYEQQEVWEEFCYCKTWNDAKNLEKYFINYFDSFNNGYNSTLGGDGILGKKHSKRAREKMSGPRPQTSKALKGKPKSEEHKRNLSKACMGRKISAEAKCKISEKMKIRNSDENWQNKIAVINGGKAFIVLELSSNREIGIWISQRKCARDLNLQQSHIIKCLKGKYKQHKGYIFRYIGENHASI